MNKIFEHFGRLCAGFIVIGMFTGAIGDIRKAVTSDSGGDVISSPLTFSNQVTMTVPATQDQQLVRYKEFTNSTQGAITNVTSVGGGTSLINQVSAQLAKLKSLIPGANVIITDNGTNISIAVSSSGTGVTNVINEPGATSNLVSSASGSIIAKIKGLLPGANVTITDNGTNLTIASSGGGSSASAVTNAPNFFIAPYTNVVNGTLQVSNLWALGVLNMGGFTITNQANGVNPLDSANYGQLTGATNVAWGVAQYPLAVTNVANEPGATSNLVTTGVNARNVKVKGLLPAANVTITDSTTNLTIGVSGLATTAYVDGATNATWNPTQYPAAVTNVDNEVGTGSNIISSAALARNVKVKKLLPGSGITITDTTTSLTIAASASALGVTNVINEPGSTTNLVSSASGAIIAKIKGLLPGANVTLTDNGTNITIASSGSGSSAAALTNAPNFFLAPYTNVVNGTLQVSNLWALGILNMGNNTITNLANGANALDAVNLGQLQGSTNVTWNVGQYPFAVTNVANEPGATSNLVTTAVNARNAKIKGLLPAANVTITDSTTNLTIGLTGVATTAYVDGATNATWNPTQYPAAVTNVDNEVGTGTNVISSAALTRNVKVKKLLPGSGITITDTTTSLTFSASATGATAVTNAENLFIAPYSNTFNGFTYASNLTMNGVVNMNGKAITNLLAAVNGKDAVNFTQLQNATNVVMNPTQYPLALTNAMNEVGATTNLVSTSPGAIAVKVKGLLPGANVTLTDNGTNITIASTGGASGVTNVTNEAGTGTNLVSTAVAAANVKIKNLIPGNNITITDSGTNLTIASATASALQFVSTDFVWTTSSIYTNAHGLGATPTFVHVFLRNTSTDQGYAVSNIIEIASQGPPSTSAGNITQVDSTNVMVVVGAAAPNVVIRNTFGVGAVTPSKWLMFVTAQIPGGPASGVTNVTNEAGATTNLVSSAAGAVKATIKGLLPGSNITLTDNGTNVTIAAAGAASAAALTNAPNFFLNPYTNVVNGTLQVSNFWALGVLNAGNNTMTNLANGANALDAVNLGQLQGATNVTWNVGQYPFAVTNVANEPGATSNLVTSGVNARNVKVKGLLPGANITITDSGTNLTIASTASGSGAAAVTNAQNFFITPYTNFIPVIANDILLTSNGTSIAEFSPTGAVFNMSVVVTNKVINYSAVVTNVWDCNAAQNAIFTLTNNACLLLSNYWAGGKYSCYVIQNSIGNWTMTLVPTNNFKTANGITGLGYFPTTNANARDLLNFDVFTNGDVTWSVFRKIQ